MLGTADLSHKGRPCEMKDFDDIVHEHLALLIP